MKKIQSLEGQRWFIWTIVFLIVAGVALVTYINYSSVTGDENSPVAFLMPHAPRTATPHAPSHK